MDVARAALNRAIVHESEPAQMAGAVGLVHEDASWLEATVKHADGVSLFEGLGGLCDQVGRLRGRELVLVQRDRRQVRARGGSDGGPQPHRVVLVDPGFLAGLEDIQEVRIREPGKRR